MAARCLAAWALARLASGGPLWPTDPMPCRDDLVVVAQRHFYRTGLAAEIGVSRGGFAGNNARSWRGLYFIIDTWASRDVGGDLDLSYRENRRNVVAALRSTLHVGNRTRMVRGRSAEVARFEDGAFDWVYVDALRTYEAVTSDLHAWCPKVRRGGLFSGDGWADALPADVLTREQMNRGVIRAVTEFAQSKGHQLFVTYWLDCYSHLAWYFVKDYASWAWRRISTRQMTTSSSSWLHLGVIGCISV